MLGVLNGFATIAAVVAVGWLLAHLRVLDQTAQVALSRLSFAVASPALLLTVLQRTSLDALLSPTLWTSLASVVVVVAIYLTVAAVRWPGRPLGDRVVGALCCSYVNAGNLGIPIALYVLGDVAWVAPTLLLQLLVLTPVAMALLAHDGRAGGRRLRRTLRGTLGNPITVGAVAGLLLGALDLRLPVVVSAPVELLAAMAVPSMLIAFGISLRRGPRPAAGTSAGHVGLLVALKALVQPAVALAVGALAFGLRGQALLAVVVIGALPTAQNIFTYAVRYGREVHLSRDVILLSTVVSVPVMVAVAAGFQAVSPG